MEDYYSNDEEYQKLLGKSSLELLDIQMENDKLVDAEFMSNYMTYIVAKMTYNSSYGLTTTHKFDINHESVLRDRKEAKEYIDMHTDQLYAHYRSELIHEMIWYMEEGRTLPDSYEIFKERYEKLAKEVDEKGNKYEIL